MTSQVSDVKDCYFIDLLDENSNPIELYTAKGSL